MTTSENRLIDLRDIKTYYEEEYSNTKTAQRVVGAENSRKKGINSLVLEETETGEFFLIENFQLFAALKKCIVS
ncbi:hypothetical protein FH966_01925 [Lentibacillus cibarius]|uniref:Uncharacterized protein n=1 Tax=Lentibacillus cibarius TaxID=2583219 RepID=A0A549YFB4_9BACI|nr:hypothetical protein [Lentibacillus cibarius]TRM10576.1 hypothetical protein FH966_01925 [Lentibacillus cibarius]